MSTSQPESQAQTSAAPSVSIPWWRRWSEPVVAVTIIVSLIAALTMAGVTVFQSLNEDINSSEARLLEAVKLAEIRQETRLNEVKTELKEDIAELRKGFKEDIVEIRKDFKEDIAGLRKDFKEDIVEIRKDFKEDIAELKVDSRAMNEKLDRVLEALLAAQS